MKGCPVSINIPAFVEQVKMVISQRLMRLFQSHQHFLLYVDVYAHRRASARASVSEASNDPVSIGKLERFVADTARENGIKPKTAAEKNGKKVAVIGSGPAGLTCAGDLAKLGYDVTILRHFTLPAEY